MGTYGFIIIINNLFLYLLSTTMEKNQKSREKEMI